LKQGEDSSPTVDCIVVALRDSLDEQTTHAKVCSSHCYEKQNLMEKMMTQSCQTCTTWSCNKQFELQEYGKDFLDPLLQLGEIKILWFYLRLNE
jgi:hypothetical protein